MLLWCKAGKGLVAVNGHAYPMEAGRYLFLPWGHRIHYQASQDDPFLVGAVHVIPKHAANHPVRFHVAHHERDELARVAYRQDVAPPELSGLKVGWLEAAMPLPHLLEYIVRLFIPGNPPEWLARQLAQELLHELILHEAAQTLHEHDVPPDLERMKQYVLFNLSRKMSLRELIEFSRLSPSTVGRMFRQHLHSTPVQWILRTKLDRAKTLLRTRRLTVAEIAEQVGIPDVYYFSKCFKKEERQSPLAYRRQREWL
jgi:AraC-like DNA-binding protein